MNEKIEALKKLLTEADAIAKEISDANPNNSNAHALRGRTAAALQMAGTVVLEETKPEAEAPAPKAAAKK